MYLQARKTKYLSLGISLTPKHWDFKKNAPRPNCPNIDYIKKIILDKQMEYQKQILEPRAEDKEFTVSTLIGSTKRIYKTKTVQDFFTELIEEFKSANRLGNAKIDKDTLATLTTFKNNNLDIPFSDIDASWLIQFEKWLLERDYTETSTCLRFRTLRSVFNKAIERKIIRKDIYPFDTFKISKFSTKTKKRAISKDEIKIILHLDLTKESKLVQLSRDIFVFSYLQGGINLTDIANLKYENIIDNRLHYIRQKTKREFNILLQDEAKNIINKYYDADKLESDYIFPILNKKVHITAIQRFNRIHKYTGHINKNLKTIEKLGGIEANLTTYCGRHTFGTIMLTKGVSIESVSKMLGHTNITTTQIYAKILNEKRYVEVNKVRGEFDAFQEYYKQTK